MLLGIVHLTAAEAGPEWEHDVVVVIAWRRTTRLRIAAPLGAVRSLVEMLRATNEGQLVCPRCDACGESLDLPDLDAQEAA